MYLKLIGSLAILLFLATTGLAEPIPIRIAPLLEAGTPNVLATTYLGRLITERSSGRLQVTIIDNSEFGSDNFAEAFRSQDLQLALVATEELRQDFPLLKIYELPFLFQDRMHLRQVIDSDIGQQIIQPTPPNGLHPLAVWDNASRQILSNGRQGAPETLANRLFPDTLLKDRSQGETWLESPLAEIPFLAREYGLDTATFSNHRFSCCVLLTPVSFWEQLPEDLKVIIDGAVMDATRYHRELTVQTDKEAHAQIEKNDQFKTIYLTAEERQRCFEATRQLYPEVATQEEMILIEKISRDAMKKS